MTIIVWDGKTLAGDRQSTYGNAKRYATKIFRARDGAALVGFAGSAAVGMEMLHWFEEGMDPSKFPELQKVKDEHVNMLVVWKDGTIQEFGRTAYAEQIDGPFVALGCGHDFALAAMHCGRNAVEAVELTCQLDVHCGGGADFLTFED